MSSVPSSSEVSTTTPDVPSTTTSSTISSTTTTPPEPTSSTPPSSTSEPPPPTSTATSETPTSTISEPPTSSSSVPTSSNQVITITSGNVEQTQTVVIQPSFATSSAVPSQTEAATEGFFDNTGAVAGTFTAVGVVVLVAIIFLATMFIRRRRQKQFDREVDEAALEAATAPAPLFLDDDDDNYAVRSNYSAAGPSSNYYQSDAGSHGTYAQPPLNSDNYGMTELNNLNRHASVGPGQLFTPVEGLASGAAGAGAAGVGVTRTRSMAAQPNQDNQGFGLGEGNTPYAAFAGPAYGPGTPSPGQQPHNQYGGEAYAAVGGLQRGPSSGSYNPYTGTEPVPPMPTGTPLNRSPSTATSLVNPHERQSSPPPMPPPLAIPRSADVEGDLSQPGTTHIAGRVFSGGDFGGGSTPEFAHAPIHAAQTGETGRWSDYKDDDEHRGSDESVGRPAPVQEEESEDEDEERPKVFKVTN